VPDLPSTVAGLIRFVAERYPDAAAMRWKEDGEWRDRSYADVAAYVERLAVGLIDQGIEPGDRVCVLADTSPEWAYCAFAIWSVGAIVVPIYPTNSPEECEWVAGNSGAVAAICGTAGHLDKLRQVHARLPALRSLMVFEAGEGTGDAVPLANLAAKDGDTAEIDRRIADVAPEDPFLIIYTSGTTGPPKGCVLSHRNGVMVCKIVQETGTIHSGDVAYLYLPLAHVFAQIVQVGVTVLGGTMAYFSGDTRQIIPELSVVKPDYIPSVPRIFEKLYTLGTAQIPPDQMEDVRRAVEAGVEIRSREHHGEPVPPELREGFDPVDERLFKPVRQLFGGKVREATTGAAPIAREILEFFYAAGVPVMEGYGMTESTGLGISNRPEQFRFGTVGRPLEGVEVTLAEDGEILMRGAHVFSGYWQNEEATSEVLDDEGWLHTGDLGAIDDDGFVSITGRKKDIIITAGGKNLAPANVENDLKQSRFISQAVMYGDRRPFPVAIVTLDEEEIVPWARERGLPETVPELAENDEVRALIQDVLDDVNSKYAQVEQVKKFTVLDHDLSGDRGELTPTLKVKRNVVYDHYADVFDDLYAKKG
jgi:long-chain acyl-CoA synthetase